MSCGWSCPTRNRRTRPSSRRITSRCRNRSALLLEQRNRLLERHEVAPVLTVGAVDGRRHLRAYLFELSLDARDHRLELEDPLHAREVQAIVGQLLDAAKLVDVR